MKYYNLLAYNIKIDGIKVIFASDTATGDGVSFSLGYYTVDTGNTSTSGDLTSGVQIAVNLPVTTAGYEQIYFDDLTVASSEVSSGKVLLAHCKQNGVDSDLNARMEVFYHFN